MALDFKRGLSWRSRRSFGLSVNTQTIEPSSPRSILFEASRYFKTLTSVGYSTCRGRTRIKARLEGKLPASWMHRSIMSCVSNVGLCFCTETVASILLCCVDTVIWPHPTCDVYILIHTGIRGYLTMSEKIQTPFLSMWMWPAATASSRNRKTGKLSDLTRHLMTMSILLEIIYQIREISPHHSVAVFQRELFQLDCQIFLAANRRQSFVLNVPTWSGTGE